MPQQLGTIENEMWLKWTKNKTKIDNMVTLYPFMNLLVKSDFCSITLNSCFAVKPTIFRLSVLWRLTVKVLWQALINTVRHSIVFVIINKKESWALQALLLKMTGLFRRHCYKRLSCSGIVPNMAELFRQCSKGGWAVQECFKGVETYF